MTPFRQPIRPDDVGTDVLAYKRALRKMGAQDAAKLVLNRRAGAWFVHVIRALEHNRGLHVDGVAGEKVHTLVAPHFDARGRWLYQHAAIRKPHSQQNPPLPAHIYFPRGELLRGSGAYGLQPWIAPQVEAAVRHFGLSVTAGYGGHPPHAPDSDHMWGGAADMAGPLENMVRATFYGDYLVSIGVLRWVGGPAHDPNGIEAGHYNHVHWSWFATHATTIFGTKEFS